MSSIAAIVLAAGRGTRMKSDLPKVLHTAAGLPLIAYPLSVLNRLKIKPTTLVVGDHQPMIREALSDFPFKGVRYARQNPPLGTGHAVMAGLKNHPSHGGDFLILYGDMPLIEEETLRRLIQVHKKSRAVLSFVTAPVNGQSSFGRVVRNRQGVPCAIVEYKDATDDQKKINEVNVGIYLVDAKFLKEALRSIRQNNAQKEYYLTDLVKLAASENRPMATVSVNDSSEAKGVNSQLELAEVSQLIYRQRVNHLASKGVQFVSPESIIMSDTVTIGPKTLVYGPSHLLGKTTIGKSAILEPGAVIKNSRLGDYVKIKAHSCLEEAVVESGAEIGPFAHLRPQAHIGPEAKIGNFVEVKKSRIGRGSKANHLSYIGDTIIGQKVNVGAGTITCNYDGIDKHQTVIEDGVFVGSDTQFVAPVRIGKNATIGAGSTITQNVKPRSLALTRSPQISVQNWGRKKRKLLMR